MRAESTSCCRIGVFAVLTLLAACGSDKPSQATVVEPSFDEPCRYEKCSDHGQCAAAPEGGPMCLCNVGYGGSDCASCEHGFHLDALGRCAPDRSCAKQASNPCGANGRCDDSDGVIMCDCAAGYEGPRCTLCVSGFGRNQYGECLMLVIEPDAGTKIPPTAGNEPPGPGTQPGMSTEPPAPALCTPDSCNGRGACKGDTGRIECTCDAAYSGARCATCASKYRRDTSDACVPFDTCAQATCGDHGSCDDAGGVIVCTCDTGFTGETCASCAPGFHSAGADCALDATCMSNTCASHGTCSEASASVSCACNAAYAGTNCERCASGYHHSASDDSCVVNEVCATNECGAHGTCNADTGVIVCSCADGYKDGGVQGQRCADCAAGFHDAGAGSCALDEQCQPGSCATHSTCDESSGMVVCACSSGYGGEKCDACASGYYLNYASKTCAVFVCQDNPIKAAGLLTFEDVLFFPQQLNNCSTKADLNTADVKLSSIQGDGTVWSCAPSDIYGLMTRHTMLEAGATGPAELTFSGPISTLAFDYAAKTALTLQVLADGAVISTLTAAKKSTGSLSFTFPAPITVFGLRSTTVFTNEIALDNIAYAPPACH